MYAQFLLTSTRINQHSQVATKSLSYIT